jgi:predicted helicase
LADTKTKMDARSTSTKAIFKLVSNGLKTQRDEWVYDRDREGLIAKVRYLIDTYENARRRKNDPVRDAIK